MPSARSRSSTLSAVTLRTSRNRAELFGLMVLPRLRMKSSSMP